MALTKDHYIQLKDGAFDGTTRDDLDNLFKTLVEAHPNKIVLHFHGGLVDAAQAMQSAENLTQRYQDINTYQIFFIWETGVMEVIQQEGGVLGFIQTQIAQVGQEEIFQQLLMRVLQFAKAKVDSANPGASRSVDGGLDYGGTDRGRFPA